MQDFRRLRIKMFPTKQQKEVLDYGIDLHRQMYNSLVQNINPLINEGEFSISTKVPRNEHLEEYLITVFYDEIVKAGFSLRMVRGVVRNYLDAWRCCYNTELETHKEPAIHKKENFKQSISFVDLEPNFIYFENKKYGKFFLSRRAASSNIPLKNKTDPANYSIKIKENPEVYRAKLGKEAHAKEYVAQRVGTEYYLIITYEYVLFSPIRQQNTSVGLDWGLIDYFIDNNGNRFNLPPRYFRLMAKIEKLKHVLWRKTKGSNNYQKVALKLQKAWVRSSNIKKAWLEKTTKELLTEYSYIFIEDIDNKELMNKGGKLKQLMSQNSNGMFVFRLCQKSKIYGTTVQKVNRFFPSSQLCSNCNKLTGKKATWVREFTCPFCGTHHDRDVNAAKNILIEGKRMLSKDQPV